MCGIAGILNLNVSGPVVQDELERMAYVLAHRGPDDSGIYIDPATRNCGLAHRRLAIIDLTLGRQPLCNEDRTLWITYNGECYNFPQLKQQLIAAGHTFKTNCDTEVVLHLYEQYGRQCLDHIHGMFAFAIWNSKTGELFLARDRMGKKPLYYSFHKGRFIFASECKAILQTDNFTRRPDRQSILQYLLLQYIPAPQTAFTDIKQLPPAHYLIIKPGDTAQPAPSRYWSIPTEQTFTGTFDDASDALRHELTLATKMRMISDVPLGAFLSGGLDSTAIVALMSQSHSQPIKTCSIGFENQRYNELPYARQAARHFGCDHQEHIVSPDCAKTIEQLSHFYDEPFADSSALPTFLLSKLARQRVTVALTGDGADEALGGYNRYKAMIWSQRISHIGTLKGLTQSRIWQKIHASEHHSLWHQCKRFMAAASLPPAQRYLKWLAVFDTDMLKSLLCQTDTVEHLSTYLNEFFRPQHKDRPRIYGLISRTALPIPGPQGTRTGLLTAGSMATQRLHRQTHFKSRHEKSAAHCHQKSYQNGFRHTNRCVVPPGTARHLHRQRTISAGPPAGLVQKNRHRKSPQGK